MSNQWVKKQQAKLADRLWIEYLAVTNPMEPPELPDEWINELDEGAWRAWVRESWLPSNAQGLQGAPVGKARQEGKTSKEEEGWRKSTIPERKAWI